MKYNIENGIIIQCVDLDIMNKVEGILFEEVNQKKTSLKNYGRSLHDEHNDLLLPLCFNQWLPKLLPSTLRVKTTGWRGFKLLYSVVGPNLYLAFITRWVPCQFFVERLADSIKMLISELGVDDKVSQEIRIQYKYIGPALNCAGIMKWNNLTGFVRNDYEDIQEYFKNEDREAFGLIINEYPLMNTDQAIEKFLQCNNLGDGILDTK